MNTPPPTARRRPKAEAIGPLDAACLLGVSENTIYRLIRERKLPAIRVGKQWRIMITDLRRGSR